VRRWLPSILIACCALPLATATANAPPSVVVVDRVIAVVGHEPILLSDLRAQLKPHRIRLDKSGPKDGPARAAAERALERQMLDRMIEDRVFAGEAERSKIAVSASEIDSALSFMANEQGITVGGLMAKARELGMTETEYRAEIRRQLIEGKVLQLRVVPRIKSYSTLTEPAKSARLAEERNKWLGEERAAYFIELRL